MRVARGLFRLWVVATVLWMSAVVAYDGKTPFEGLWKPPAKYEIQHETGVTLVLDGSQSPKLLKAQMVDAAKRAAAQLEEQGDSAGAKKQLEWAAGTSVDQVLKYVSDDNAKRSEQLYSALSWLLCPPFGLLALGLMTGWVARGFRG